MELGVRAKPLPKPKPPPLREGVGGGCYSHTGKILKQVQDDGLKELI